MTKTNYELTIGGKLRKVYKNSGGFFVKINGGNLNVNNYFLKNGSGLKSKYKTKGGDANEDGVFYNLVDIEFTNEKGNPVKVMVDSIINHLNDDIKNLKGTISAEKIILYIYYKLFNEAKKDDKDELKTLIEYVLFSFYPGYNYLNHTSLEEESDKEKIKNEITKIINEDKIDKVIQVAIDNNKHFTKKNNTDWINSLFDNTGNFKTTEAAERSSETAKTQTSLETDSEKEQSTEQLVKSNAEGTDSEKEQSTEQLVKSNAEGTVGGKNKNKNKVSSKNYLKKKLSNNKK